MRGGDGGRKEVDDIRASKRAIEQERVIPVYKSRPDEMDSYPDRRN